MKRKDEHFDNTRSWTAIVPKWAIMNAILKNGGEISLICPNDR